MSIQFQMIQKLCQKYQNFILKTTYVDEKYPGFCNGFTLGSHGEYLEYRSLSKELYNPKAPKIKEIQ